MTAVRIAWRVAMNLVTDPPYGIKFTIDPPAGNPETSE